VSNPGAASRGPWIASSQELLAMTGDVALGGIANGHHGFVCAPSGHKIAR
jgi:hypothetical protein